MTSSKSSRPTSRQSLDDCTYGLFYMLQVEKTQDGIQCKFTSKQEMGSASSEVRLGFLFFINPIHFGGTNLQSDQQKQKMQSCGHHKELFSHNFRRMQLAVCTLSEEYKWPQGIVRQTVHLTAQSWCSTIAYNSKVSCISCAPQMVDEI